MQRPNPVDDEDELLQLRRPELPLLDHVGQVSVRRAKTAERDGRVAVVLDVPMEECPACGEHWLAWDVAARLDELLTSMLTSDVEVATRHYDQPDDRTAA